jgi:hypothetical protein
MLLVDFSDDQLSFHWPLQESVTLHSVIQPSASSEIVRVLSAVLEGKISQWWLGDDRDLSMLVDTDLNRSVYSGSVDLTAEALAETSRPRPESAREYLHMYTSTVR